VIAGANKSPVGNGSGPDGSLVRPLSRHKFLETRDPEEAHARVSELFAPHQLDLPDGPSGFHTVYHHMRLRALSLYYFEYRTAVTVRSGPMMRDYLLLLPASGSCAVDYGSRLVTVPIGSAYIVNPFAPLALQWTGKSAMRVIKIDRQEVERALSGQAQHGQDGSVEFDPEAPIPLSDLPGVSGFVDALFADLDMPEPALGAADSEEKVEALLLSLLLRRYPHSQRQQLLQPAGRAAPYYVRRVEEFIRLHAAEVPDMAAMVRVAGVSARTLFKGFRDFRGIGPAAFLKQVRLDRLHADLLAADPATTVTDLAATWGFHHPGNLARDYKIRFGESPSQTVKRAKAAKDALPRP